MSSWNAHSTRKHYTNPVNKKKKHLLQLIDTSLHQFTILEISMAKQISIHGILAYIYLHEMVDFYGFHVGINMDVSRNSGFSPQIIPF